MRLRAMTAPLVSIPRSNREDPEQEIILSSRDGYVWASWPKTNATIRLGRHEMVAVVMQDFLAQDALGQRLANVPAKRSLKTVRLGASGLDGVMSAWQ